MDDDSGMSTHAENINLRVAFDNNTWPMEPPGLRPGRSGRPYRIEVADPPNTLLEHAEHEAKSLHAPITPLYRPNERTGRPGASHSAASGAVLDGCVVRDEWKNLHE